MSACHHKGREVVDGCMCRHCAGIWGYGCHVLNCRYGWGWHLPGTLLWNVTFCIFHINMRLQWQRTNRVEILLRIILWPNRLQQIFHWNIHVSDWLDDLIRMTSNIPWKYSQCEQFASNIWLKYSIEICWMSIIWRKYSCTQIFGFGNGSNCLEIFDLYVRVHTSLVISQWCEGFIILFNCWIVLICAKWVKDLEVLS